MKKATNVLLLISGVLLLTGFALAFLVAPQVAVERDGKIVEIFSQKIFYYHVPVSWAALLSLIIGAVFGAMFLIKKERKYDFLSYASIEIGYVFGILIMWTGVIWTRAEWGKWWEWEPRLTTALVLMLTYAGYFVLRSSINEESSKARFGAVYSIIAAVNVPLTIFSIRLIPSVHPIVFSSSGANMEGPMLAAFLISGFGMVALCIAFLLLRYQTQLAGEEVDYIKSSIGG